MPTRNAEMDPVWKALSDPTRRALLDLVREKPRTTGDLTTPFEPQLTRFGVMRHIAVLEAAGLLVARREGRQVWHHLNAVPLRRIYERWVSEYRSQWAGSLLRIKDQSELSSQPDKEERIMADFAIEQEVEIAASPEAVFNRLVGDVTAWWDHGFSDSPAGIYLEPEIGGRFHEVFGEGGGALYATVTYLSPNKEIRLSGPMGMKGVTSGVIAFVLEPKGEGTVLKLSHRATGEGADEMTHQGYTAGWNTLLAVNLKTLCEQGAASPAV